MSIRLDSVEPILLTQEQAGIVAAAPGDRLLITAGAGTGKTHVLVERLAKLSDEDGLGLADEVMVMSFSRAAVSEVRRRMKAHGGAVAYGTVTTFDSFASGLLARHSEAESPLRDFDARVLAAVDLLEGYEPAQSEIKRLKHVIVDEVQDLVGVRRRLVQAVLSCANSGFTLFGDPAQGIYNFQADTRVERQLGSLVFFEWAMREVADPRVKIITLTSNFRFRTDAARVASWAGTELNSSAPRYSEILERLEADVLRAPSVGSASDFACELAAEARSGSTSETVGVLCHYNVDVLLISQVLAEHGVEHHYQRSARDRTIPAWVGRALGHCESATMRRRTFEDVVSQVPDAPHDAWELVKRLDRSRNRDSLDLHEVQRSIRTGNIPPEFGTPPSSPIVVSTIHRAKGLEFDRVVLFEPESRECPPDEIPEWTRQLYVALTRARSRYGWIERGGRSYASRRGNPGDLWALHGFAGTRRYVKAIEIQGSQAWEEDPAGAFVFTSDARDIQAYIETSIRPLDRLVLRKEWAIAGDSPRVFYIVEHGGQRVGVVDIGRIVKEMCRPREDKNWPSTIDSVFVESIDTVAGSSSTGIRAGLSSAGLWLRVRPYGLGRLHWEAHDA